ncbi:hypothetical protein DRP04_05975 [Archaeoglobales archaeon]|nr:MAG: hypothetical protein DRP04_05975 [Archaeoglobales archaeon]
MSNNVVMEDFELLPAEIRQHIDETLQKEFEYRYGAVHVTELLYCLRKAYFRRIGVTAEQTDKSKWFFYRGLIFDKLWTGIFARNQVRVTHRIPHGPVIVGRIDFIIRENGEDIICELKTVANRWALKEGPKEDHVKQVKFYAWCENVQKAQLIYVSFEGVKVYDIDCSDVDQVVKELEEYAKLLQHCLVTQQLPPKTERQWECQNCEFKYLCEAPPCCDYCKKREACPNRCLNSVIFCSEVCAKFQIDQELCEEFELDPIAYDRLRKELEG